MARSIHSSTTPTPGYPRPVVAAAADSTYPLYWEEASQHYDELPPPCLAGSSRGGRSRGPWQEQWVLMGVHAATHKVELRDACLPVLVLVGGGVAAREGLDRLERRRRMGSRQEVVLLVFLCAACPRGEVLLQSCAAHAGAGGLFLVFSWLAYGSACFAVPP
jgi:hypothetical protein